MKYLQIYVLLGDLRRQLLFCDFQNIKFQQIEVKKVTTYCSSATYGKKQNKNKTELNIILYEHSDISHEKLMTRDNFTARNQETAGVISNSSCNCQQKNSKFHIYYYIIVCNSKPAEVRIDGPSR